MSSSNRIPIPWRHRLRRFQYGALPALFFVVCMVIVVWMWQAQGQMPNASGEVEARRKPVTTGTEGLLLRVKPPDKTKLDLTTLAGQITELQEWERYGTDWMRSDPVSQGDIIARLDPRPVEADLQVAVLGIERLKQELEKAKEELRLSEAGQALTLTGIESDHYSTLLQLTTDKEAYEIGVLDRESLLAKSKLILQRFDKHLGFVEEARLKKTISPVDYLAISGQREEAKADFDKGQLAIKEARDQLIRATGALAKFKGEHPELPKLPVARRDMLFAPLLTAIKEQQLQMRKLGMQIDSLVIRAPSSGTICQVDRGPGDYVQAGEQILVIAANTGRYIVSYVREGERMRPSVGTWEVEVKRPVPGSRGVLATIEHVGPQVESIPAHQRRDPMREEWGVPVHISLPDPEVLRLLPGEKVDVLFKVKAAG